MIQLIIFQKVLITTSISKTKELPTQHFSLWCMLICSPHNRNTKNKNQVKVELTVMRENKLKNNLHTKQEQGLIFQLELLFLFGDIAKSAQS